ncbi:MAG: hypothetical protein QOE13_114 [Gaiellaceae bacterium]|jgi:uncharacterized membrane protein YoaK (UPF0700 family)|nr:hypothetical protein [Gaiellaceae bacterium]
MRDLLLFALTLSTGAVDAFSWLGLGKVFSAFMTGNVVFVGFRAGGAPGPALPRVLSAVAAFAVGAAVAGWMVRGVKREGSVWPRRVTLTLAVGLVPQAIFLALWLAVDGRPSSQSGNALIALSALAMGTQTIAVFSLGVRAVFTTAATATLAVFMGDLSGLPQSNGERGRLVATIVALLGGACAGAALFTHARSWAPLLPLAVTAIVIAAAELVFQEQGSVSRPAPRGAVGTGKPRSASAASD